MNFPVSDPSAPTVNGNCALSSMTIPPAAAAIVGTARTRISVPRSTATSPPSSIFRG
jgi:hypothetical protein